MALFPIKKEDAKATITGVNLRDKKGRWAGRKPGGKGVHNIRKIRVQHPGMKARNFIQAGRNYLNNQGKDDARVFIRNLIKLKRSEG